jgi:3alpha(or 20beta)-hydroxysteroid dehydrogenase
MNIVVTGAANGLGAALTTELRAHGHQVARLDIALPEGPLVEEDGGLAQHFDVADAAAWEMLVAELGARGWTVDAVINNAGVGVYGPIATIKEEDWQHQLDVSLTGPWLSLKYLAPTLSDQGVVLNIGSRRGLAAVAERSAYCAAKFGLRGLTLAAAAELPIKVGVVELDSMLTNFQGALADKQRRAAAGELFLDPVAVAKTIADILEGKQPWQTEWRLRATATNPQIETVTDQLW